MSDEDIVIREFLSALPETHFIRQYAEYFYEMSGGYWEYKTLCAMFGLSVLAERKLRMNPTYGEIFSNIDILLLGTAGFSGKTTSTKEIERVLNAVGVSDTKAPTRASVDGLAQCLSEKPQGYMVSNECGDLFKNFHKANHFMNELSGYLCDLFDCPSEWVKKNASKAPFIAKDVYLSLLWTTTPANFEAGATGDDISSGLLSRFVITNPKRIPEYRETTFTSNNELQQYNEILVHAGRILHIVRQYSDITLTPSSESLALFNQEAKGLFSLSSSDDESTILIRINLYVWKFCMLIYLGSEEFLDNQKKIKEQIFTTQKPVNRIEVVLPEWIMPIAQKLVYGYFYPQARVLYTRVRFTADDTIAKRVLGKLIEQPDNTVTRSDLLMTIKNVRSKELELTLNTLEEDGIVSSAFVDSTDKRGQKHSALVYGLTQYGREVFS